LSYLNLLLFLRLGSGFRTGSRYKKFEGLDPDLEKVIRIHNTALQVIVVILQVMVVILQVMVVILQVMVVILRVIVILQVTLN